MTRFLSVGLLVVCSICAGCGREKLRKLESENRVLKDSVDLLTNSVHSLEQGMAALKDVPENCYARAVDLSASGNYSDACSLFQSLIQRYPSSPLVSNAKAQLVNLNGALAKIEADRKAEERRQQQEEKRKQEEAKYQPLSQDAAIAQWKEFRNHQELEGTVTTWEFKIHLVSVTGNVIGFLDRNMNNSVAITGTVGSTTYEDAAGAGLFPEVKENDWVAVTGKFGYVSDDGYVVLIPIRVRDLGYSE